MFKNFKNRGYNFPAPLFILQLLAAHRWWVAFLLGGALLLDGMVWWQSLTLWKKRSVVLAERDASGWQAAKSEGAEVMRLFRDGVCLGQPQQKDTERLMLILVLYSPAELSFQTLRFSSQGFRLEGTTQQTQALQGYINQIKAALTEIDIYENEKMDAKLGNYHFVVEGRYRSAGDIAQNHG